MSWLPLSYHLYTIVYAVCCYSKTNARQRGGWQGLLSGSTVAIPALLVRIHSGLPFGALNLGVMAQILGEERSHT